MILDDFTTYLRDIRNYSEKTTAAYRSDIEKFSRWAKDNIPNARWSIIKRSDIDRYIVYLTSMDMKPTTTNRAISSISALYKYFKRQGLLSADPTQYESRRKVEKKVPNTIPLQDLRAAYDNAYGAVKIMLALLITTGIRIQELLDMRWQDINFKEHTIKISGKGLKQRYVYTPNEALSDLETISAYTKPSDLIFPIDQRKARRMIYDALKPYSQAPQLSPHAIRHTFATQLARSGTNVSTLATILGHNRIETTQTYIDLGQSNVKDTMMNSNIL